MDHAIESMVVFRVRFVFFLLMRIWPLYRRASVADTFVAMRQGRRQLIHTVSSVKRTAPAKTRGERPVERSGEAPLMVTIRRRKGSRSFPAPKPAASPRGIPKTDKRKA